ncbi:ABC-type multidrug transport system, ATPase component [Synechococcus sp. PCC 7502]|uniref:ABC transporter ATP-binding protein n=1 Tax=Synechococcus sp. PCC 7502 TaxID=1173263 RepID=UPI00029FA68F|nr:ABC transporter ATP-binding protein [Synechococcus sp. PCC 7502]AFY72370.1 ABC-type multidrug transport system, ATPase component [Synechococcus sp. PCC 7502]
MSPVAILLDQVYKHYNQVPVVNNLSLQILQGEMFGLLGANGAGKSTTIRMLTTLTRPSQGRISLGGLDVIKQSQQVKSQIGVVLQQISVDLDLTLWENMEYHGRLHHLPEKERRDSIQRCLDYVDLNDRSQVLVRTLSGGMKRRLQIARALLHQPQILFLDEPTVGLDPQTRRRLWEIIKDLKEQGMTILLTTHYMEEAEFLCDRIGIMNNGSLIEIGTPAELRQKYGLAVVVSQNDQQIAYKFFADYDQAHSYVEAQSDKRGIMVRDSNLEDIFVELTGRKLD